MNRNVMTLIMLALCVKGFSGARIEAKGGYYRFNDEKLRQVYHDGTGDVQLTGSFCLWKQLHLYAAIEYLEKHGHSINGNQGTKIWMVPLSLGAQGIFKITERIEYYLTLGPRYFFVHTKNHSAYVDHTKNRSGLGGFVGTGFTFCPGRHFFFDINAEYSYKRLHFHTSKENVHGHSVNVGGLFFGGGVGIKF